LSDVQLYEDYPAHYSADVSRRHRWIRGDWQLAGWLLRRVPGRRAGEDGGAGPCRQANPLSPVAMEADRQSAPQSRPAALTLLLLLGWTRLASAWSWTLSVIGIVLLVPCLCGDPRTVSQAG
jgi:cyclic beta-1,2-glucan synthetase